MNPVFDFTRARAHLEELRFPNGAFIAAPGCDYQALWLRDHLYASLAYRYLGEPDKVRDGLRVVLDVLRLHAEKLVIQYRISPGEFLHAKYHPETFAELTNDWGHHQLDAIGLFLYMIGHYGKKYEVMRDQTDYTVLTLLVFYLYNVRYWEAPDNGMWEEGLDLHTSSLGACISALDHLSREDILAPEVNLVMRDLVKKGIKTFRKILPNESPTRTHDLSQLSLIWPYHILGERAEEVIARITRRKGLLVRAHGLNRYPGDTWPRQGLHGESAEWPMGFFWLSIVYAKFEHWYLARHWFDSGVRTMVDGVVPELYVDGRPNEHTPLAWGQSLALIAYKKIEKTLR